MAASLYERLGGSEGIRKIASDLVDLHVIHPRISTRFSESDIPAVKELAANFFIAGTGGPEDAYTGMDMLSAHRGMNIDDSEFVAVLDDVLVALDKNGIGQREKEEALYIFYGLKGDIVLR